MQSSPLGRQQKFSLVNVTAHVAYGIKLGSFWWVCLFCPVFLKNNFRSVILEIAFLGFILQ